MVSGIMWLLLFGCAVTLSVVLISGQLAARHPRLVPLAYVGLCFSVLATFWQLIPAVQQGVVWQRVTPLWWWVAFIFINWLAFVVGELWRARGQPLRWQASLRAWSIRRLRAMAPEKRERFLAHFAPDIRDSYRKEV
jgi:xanthine/uracil permease